MDELYHKYIKYKKKYVTLKKLQKGGADNNLTFFYEFNKFETIPPITFDLISDIKKLSAGTNGCIMSSNFIFSDTAQLKLVLKKTLKSTSDNNFYEFIVGLCLNVMKKYYPNFAFTFAYFISKTKKSCANEYDIKSDILLFKHDDAKGTVITKDNLYDSCVNNERSGVILENIVNSGEVARILPEILRDTKLANIHIFNILFQVYAVLHYMSDFYTHYDLSSSNVMLTHVPDGKYMKIIYHLEKEVVIYTKYVPVIIDYGRSFIDFNEIMLGYNSKNIYDILCTTQCNTYYPSTENCKAVFGYRSAKTLGKYTNNEEFYYINSVARNKSHDLLFIEYVMEYIDHSDTKLKIFNNFNKYARKNLWCSTDKKNSFSNYRTIKFGQPTAESSYSVTELDIRKQKIVSNDVQRKLCRNINSSSIGDDHITINNVDDCFNWLLDEYDTLFHDIDASIYNGILEETKELTKELGQIIDSFKHDKNVQNQKYMLVTGLHRLIAKKMTHIDYLDIGRKYIDHFNNIITKLNSYDTPTPTQISDIIAELQNLPKYEAPTPGVYSVGMSLYGEMHIYPKKSLVEQHKDVNKCRFIKY
jgi:hypothetical protein